MSSESGPPSEAAPADPAPAAGLSPGRAQLLQERLRAKAASQQGRENNSGAGPAASGCRLNSTELSKAVRHALLQRRFQMDSEEKGIMSKSIHLLQERIPVSTSSALVERLELTGNKLGLKFMTAPAHGQYYLSADMFCLEINIDQTGRVNEAKIHHVEQGQPGPYEAKVDRIMNCPDIIDCLARSDFKAFNRHVEGLLEIYGLKATGPEKSKLWVALTVMEDDLNKIYNSYRNYPNLSPHAHIHSTALGLLHPRTGGLPMRLRYFVAPIHLTSSRGDLLPLTIDTVTSKNRGLTATVKLEESEQSNRMQICNLVNFENGQISVTPLSQVNSNVFPARFVLELSEPVALTVDNCEHIRGVTGFEFYNRNNTMPIMQLIAMNKSNNQIDPSNNRGLFVTLPGQQHCYFLSDPEGLRSVLVSRIPFSHASDVKEIITALRTQQLFNTLIESCVRPNATQDLEKSQMFEISCTDLQQITVSFELQSDTGMAYLEVNLTDVGRVQCTLHDGRSGDNASSEISELLSTILDKTLSIPVSMRAMVQAMERKATPQNQGSTESQTRALGNLANGNETAMGMETENHNYSHDQAQNSTSYTKCSEPSTSTFKVPREEIDDGGGGNGRDLSGSAAHSARSFSVSSSNSNSSTFLNNPMKTEVKSEPMDCDIPNKDFQADSLNEFWPQDVTFNPEATSHKNPSRTTSTTNKKESPSRTSSSLSSSSSSISKFKPPSSVGSASSRTDMTIKPEKESTAATKLEPVEPHLSLTKSHEPPAPTPPSPTAKKPPASSERRESFSSDIKPSFSITPITTGQQTLSSSSSHSSKKAGIEIIPLGGESSSSSSTSSSKRDIKRSLSEDDKRRLDKSKKKRKHDSGLSSSGGGSSSAKKRADDVKGSQSSSSTNSMSKSKYVLSGDIELVPASKPGGSAASAGGALNPSSSKSKSGPNSSSSSNLKLTLKAPGGNGEKSSSFSKPKSSSPSSKDRYSSGGTSSNSSSNNSSGSSSKHSGSSLSKSSSSGYNSSSSKHSSSSSAQSSSSSSSNSSSVKTKSSNSSSSDRDRDRRRDRDRDRERERDKERRDHHGSSGTGATSGYHHHRGSSSERSYYSSNSGSNERSSATSSSYSGRSEKERSVTTQSQFFQTSGPPQGQSSSGQLGKEEVEMRNILAGGKLNTTFQIPKLSKGSSPSSQREGGSSSNKHTPTSSPKYAISPKGSSAGGGSMATPRYIGGGSVTPPNASPKHAYSASSGAPHHNTNSSPNTSQKSHSRTPSVSPTLGASGKFSLPFGASSGSGDSGSQSNLDNQS